MKTHCAWCQRLGLPDMIAHRIERIQSWAQPLTAKRRAKQENIPWNFKSNNEVDSENKLTYVLTQATFIGVTLQDIR